MATETLDLSLLKDHISSAETRKVDEGFLSKVENFLSDSTLQPTQGRRRIILLCQNFHHFTFEQAYRFIDPEGFEREFESYILRKSGLQFLNYGRTILAIAPIIWTWFSLSIASTEYREDLLINQDDRSLSLLRLWQDGFHNTTWLTFSHDTSINVVLLATLLFLSLHILNVEGKARRLTEGFSKSLEEITSSLLNIVKAEGITPITSDADIDKVVERFKGVVEKLFSNSQKVVEDAQKAVNASERNRKYYDEHLKLLIQQLEKSTNHLTSSFANINVKEVIRITDALSQTGKHLENVTHTLQLALDLFREKSRRTFFRRLMRLLGRKDKGSK